MPDRAFQDYYPDHLAWCYGCGRLNEHGYQIKTYWDGDETVTLFRPQPHHIAIPGYVYGGLLASLIDCHGTGTAAAAAYRAEGREMDTEPALRFLTASLRVDYLKPTPLGILLTLRGRILEVKGRKVTVGIKLFASAGASAEPLTANTPVTYASDGACVQGEVIAVQVPDRYVLGLL